MESTGVWLPILEYARYRDISISTIRRMIKANRVQSRLDDGKYFIFVAKERLEKKKLEHDDENTMLRKLLQKKEEEIAELKMLLRLYEEREIPPMPPYSRETYEQIHH